MNMDAGSASLCYLVTKLPVELIVGILAILDFRDLLSCRQLCRFFFTLIEETAALQYKIELAASGMQDGPPSHVGSVARLANLTRYEESWNTLTWTQDQSISMTKGRCWELCGGVFAQHIPDTNTLKFWQLPSTHRGIETRHWSVPVLDLTVRDFGMDAAQDLLVLIEEDPFPPGSNDCLIHLRTLSSGAPHPLAPKPAVISVVVSDVLTYDLQISADYIGILFSHWRSNEFRIWDWKTGRVEIRLVATEGYSQLTSFAFLTERYVMVATIYDDCPNLQVVDFKSSTDAVVSVENAEIHCSFDFPPISPAFFPVNITIRSDPAPSWIPSRQLQVLFSTSDNNRLYVVTMWIRAARELHHVVLFVPSSTFLGHLGGISADQVPYSFAWDEWGPAGTRMMRIPRSSEIWVCYVFGSKFVTSQLQAHSSRATFAIYDFNQLACRRALQPCCASHTGSGFVQRSGRVTRGLFESTVVTSLPYRKQKLSLEIGPGEGPVDAVMCSEDNLIIVGGRQFRVLTF